MPKADKTMPSTSPVKEGFHKILVDRAPEGIIVIQGKEVLYANEALAQLIEYPLKEIYEWKTNGFINFVQEADQPGVHQRLKSAIAGEVKTKLYSLRVTTKKGKTRWLQVLPRIIKAGEENAILAMVTDITEQKQTEQAYRELVDHSLQGILIIQDMKVVFSNEAFAKMSGYSVEELLKLDPEQVEASVHPDYQARVWGRLRERLEGKPVPSHYPFKAIRKDGSERWLEMYASLIQYNGKPAVQATLIDITERQEADIALQKSEARYRSLFDDVPVGLYRTTPDGNILDANPALLQILGTQEKSALKNKSASEFYVNPDERRQWKETHAEAGIIQGHETRFQRLDGKIIWVRDSFRTIRDDDGAIQFYEGTIEDITDRKLAEEALRESELKYRTLVETSPDAITVTDLEGKVVMANRQALRLYGVKSLDAVIGKSAFEMIAPEDVPLAMENLQKTLEEASSGNLEYTLLRQDGSRYPAELNASVLIDADGKPTAFIGVIRDISDRKKGEQALRESEAKYRTLVEQSLQGIVILQGEQIKFANKPILDLLGISADGLPDFSSKEMWKLIHPDDRETLQQRLADRMAGKPVPDRYEFRMRKKDGSILWFTVWIEMIDYEGQSAIQVTLLDVTEPKRAEKTIQESELKYRRLVEQSLQGIVISQGTPPRIFFANEAFSVIVGYTMKELLALSPKKVISLIHPSDQEVVLERLTERLEGKSVPERFEYRMIRKDGSIRWVEVFETLIDYEGEPAIQSAYADITERKEAEAALRESEEKFRDLVEDSSDWVWALDIKGKITYSNNAVEDILGYSAGQVVGRVPCDFLKPEDVTRAQQTFKELVEGKRPIRTIVIRFLHREGTDVMLEARGQPILDENNALVGYRGICRDITDRLKMVEQLRALEDRI